jgi:regulator of cell morphogenesis and NO signaling
MQTLAEIATTVPGAAGVFRRYALDFCCKGDISLDEACSKRGVDAVDVERALGALPEGSESLEPLKKLTPAQLVDHIESRYHEPLRPMVDDLIAMARKVERVHGDKPACPRGLADRLEKARVDLHEHLGKEENILFPAIRRGLATALRPPISRMRVEHDEHGETLRELRALTTDFVPPEGACRTWQALYLGLAQLESELHEHVLVENHILFPGVLGEPG